MKEQTKGSFERVYWLDGVIEKVEARHLAFDKAIENAVRESVG